MSGSRSTIAVLLLLHVPPLVALLSVVVIPAHNDDAPLIDDGKAFTTIDLTVIQPALIV